MEQEAVFDVGNFDERDISLDETPRDPQHYLQQVSVSRAQCPAVTSAKIVPGENFSPSTFKSMAFKCDPPSQECLDLKEADAWRTFCLEKRNSLIPLKLEDIPKFAHHQGNPPTLRLVLSLRQTQINSALIDLTEVFIDQGYSRPLFEWIYALLLVLDDQPLNQDACASIRDLARNSRLIRDTLNKEDRSSGSLRNELTSIIAIVGVFFNQRDIVDQIPTK
ncbi:unnamed protein product [Thelazia callipaeda]|uniref:Gem-associated protein 2 n=1 Tax=Thelazia callipaeda TaxID=103827 RepID=A0A0N5CVK7_THECL|nr:unnamed protein product [Thelazia callipaeda]